MSRAGKVALVVGATLVAVLVLVVALYWTGWQAAREAAAAVALGREVPGLGIVGGDYAARLRNPRPEDVVVGTLISDFTPQSPISFYVNFIIQNSRDGFAPPIPLQITVQLGPGGWRVVGAGGGG